jgi:competence protein ComEC
VPSRSRIPAAVAAVALAAGILLARECPDAVPAVGHTCALSGALILLTTVNVVHARVRGRTLSPWTDAALMTALVTSGASMYVARHTLVAPYDASLSAPVARPSSSDARLSNASAPSAHVTYDARVLDARSGAGGRSRAIVQVRSSVGPERSRTSGRLWISLPQDVRGPSRGELVRVAGDLSRPGPARNPGAFDFRGYLADRGIHAVLAAEKVTVLEKPCGMSALHARTRTTVRSMLGGERGEVLTALLLGDTTGMPGELIESFRRSGTVHVLAVSGLHVGFIALMAYAVLRSLRVPPRAARLAVLPCLVLFVLLVGARPSVVRASVMAGAVIAAWSMERRSGTVNALGAAALALLISRPGSLFDLGFRLSFAATLGIVLLYPAVRRALRRMERLGRIGSLLADSLSLSTAAQLGVAPVALAAFGEVSLVAPLANLAAVPLAAFSVASGVAMLATSFVPELSRVFAASAWASLSGLAGVSRLAGSADWSTVVVGTRFWPVAAMLALALWLTRLEGRARRGSFAALAVAVSLAATLWLTGPGRSRPHVVAFDVGQGDAILLEIPRSKHVLVDAGVAWGGPSGPDAGRTIVVPYLRRRGVRRLEALVVTHGHRDHYGGAVAVLENCRPDVLALPAGYESSAALRGLAERATAMGIVVRAVSVGDTLFDGRGCRLVVLSPTAALTGTGVGENDRSVVLHARLGRAAVLLTGDMENRAERELLSNGRAVRADVLKVGHHGSATSSSRPFLAAVGASIGAISVGEGNRYGHPDAATARRLEESGAEVLRTDLDGALLFDWTRVGVRASGHRSGRSVQTRYGVRKAAGHTRQ